MKALGEAAIDLPWLSPAVASLTALTRGRLSQIWAQVRLDPGLALLLARSLGSSSDSERPLLEHDVSLLESAHLQLQTPSNNFIDWNQPGPARVYRACIIQARIAESLAKLCEIDPVKAWLGGLLAPLGWLAIFAIDPVRGAEAFQELQRGPGLAAWQQEAWGHDQTAIARRLSRRWRLPAWLTTVLGHLALHVRIAERLGAEPNLFQIVQLAVSLYQQAEIGLGLTVGGETSELMTALGLSETEVESALRLCFEAELPILTWEAPSRHPLLADLLALALENRRQTDNSWIEGLQRDLDRLQEALEDQGSQDQIRLQTMKISALAEFAAGAGHEINNPLAVISGQAQYILKQFQKLDGPVHEIENVGEYLDHLKGEILPSLTKIVGQTQRIRHILTDLMQFARPAQPHRESIELGPFVHDVCQSLQDFAKQHQVELLAPDFDEILHLDADPTQIRQTLVELIRNAIEAAPEQGKASLRMKRFDDNQIDLIVEDNGPGPTPAAQEHLFDPFYSGRSAGRGRGLGLSTAWRLARQNGGEVSFERAPEVTRFILRMPISLNLHHKNGNGYHKEAIHRHPAAAAS